MKEKQVKAPKFKSEKKIAQMHSFKKQPKLSDQKKALTLKTGMKGGQPIDYAKLRKETKGNIEITSKD